MKSAIGVFGMGVMGRSLALNLARRSYKVSVYDVDYKFTERLYEFAGAEIEHVNVCRELKDFMESLEMPRRILVMVTAGAPVDNVLRLMSPYLNTEDIVVDSGNSYYKDTERRSKEWAQKGVYFCGMGVSGGEKGAREGAALMPGGDRRAYDAMKSIYTEMAARTPQGIPCCGYVGPGGSGHFVKMVHNGIEYADMQLIAECYQIMSLYLHMSAWEISEVLEQWNKGRLNSFLIELTIKVLRKKDSITNLPMVEVIRDIAGEKGTGSWTAKEAMTLRAAAPAITDAVVARHISACVEDRKRAVEQFSDTRDVSLEDREAFLSALESAMYAAKICCYSQGFAVMEAASREFDWDLNLENIAVNWRAGCIIQAGFLGLIADAYRSGFKGQLFLAEPFAEEISRAQSAWREVCTHVIQGGIPAPIICGTLTYFDSFKTKRATAALIQAQRDLFGAHTYQRVDMEGSFHTKWEE